MYGKQVRGIERSTFVLGEGGSVLREWRGVKVPSHAGRGAGLCQHSCSARRACCSWPPGARRLAAFRLILRQQESPLSCQPRKPPSRIKLFVLDTNVLMHDPPAFRFAEHDVFCR